MGDADATGGAYVEGGRGEDPLIAAYEDRVLPLARASSATEARRAKEDRFQVPLLVAFLLFLLDAALAGRRRA